MHVAGGLEELNVRVTPGDMALPLMDTNFNSLSCLQTLRLAGVKFHMAFGPGFASFHCLRSVLLMDIDVSASDYSYPAQRLGLHCPALADLIIGGYPDSHTHAHLSSAGLLMQQYWRAACRPGGRLWSRVPLLFEPISLPTTIPNPDRTPLHVSLVRE